MSLQFLLAKTIPRGRRIVLPKNTEHMTQKWSRILDSLHFQVEMMGAWRTLNFVKISWIITNPQSNIAYTHHIKYHHYNWILVGLVCYQNPKQATYQYIILFFILQILLFSSFLLIWNIIYIPTYSTLEVLTCMIGGVCQGGQREWRKWQRWP